MPRCPDLQVMTRTVPGDLRHLVTPDGGDFLGVTPSLLSWDERLAFHLPPGPGNVGTGGMYSSWMLGKPQAQLGDAGVHSSQFGSLCSRDPASSFPLSPCTLQILEPVSVLLEASIGHSHNWGQQVCAYSFLFFCNCTHSLDLSGVFSCISQAQVVTYPPTFLSKKKNNKLCLILSRAFS